MSHNFDIKSVLPHRYPFLLIDKVIEVDEKRAVGIKNVSINEPFFEGHFPEYPVMPGVLVIEAMAQLSGFLLLTRVKEKKIAFLLGINNAKFRRQIIPGDQITLEVILKRFGGKVAVFSGKAFVEENIAAEAEIIIGT
jgi:3-hydroxyacyl-[acyl-carrier-protein] dehydratase